MRLNIIRAIPRRWPDGRLICRDPILTVVARPKWQRVEGDAHRLQYQDYVINLRWPVLLQIQLHVTKYGVGDGLGEHIDHIEEGEHQVRVQFIVRNARGVANWSAHNSSLTPRTSKSSSHVSIVML